MAAHDAWALICRLFAGGTPVLRATLSPRDIAVLPMLGKAVKPTVMDQSFVLCPHCQQHRAQVWGDGRGGRMCRCPDCGPVADPATPVNRPFSADFKWAMLSDGDGTPIRFTDGQAKVFESLWSFKGEATTANRIMPRAGLGSDKPSDLFKIKAKDKGKQGPEARLAAYGALVVTQQRAGRYAMPCAAAGKDVAMTLPDAPRLARFQEPDLFNFWSA